MGWELPLGDCRRLNVSAQVRQRRMPDEHLEPLYGQPDKQEPELFPCSTMRAGKTERVSFFPKDFVNCLDMAKWLGRTGVDVPDSEGSSALSNLFDEIKQGKSKLIIEHLPQSAFAPSKQRVVRVLHVMNMCILDKTNTKVLMESHREKTWKPKGDRGRKAKKDHFPSMKLTFVGSITRVDEHLFKAAAELLSKELGLRTSGMNLRHQAVHTTTFK